ncbi:hypothetical protein [Occallatibacter riparius]|uniref:DUF2946 domain-containing protein n=1 Tax=Occallatibacter riparius TaxID=1002689 RepID=A0A9J7BTI1_9BACT|nr:hypothetical protein [Occallatibacter riparius]UWZ84214.1 hypothetical protein MOP44_27160 [Occallatibacter riparius]
MARRSAFLVLAVVVLWAMSPALACLAAAPCHQCCHAMMVDCDTATMAAQPCCQLQSSNTAIPADRDATTELSSGALQTLVLVDLPDLSGAAVLERIPSKAPPPRLPSGASTILRI